MTSTTRRVGALALVLGLGGAGLSLAGFAGTPDAPSVSWSAMEQADAGAYAVDNVHSEIEFHVIHLGISTVTGQFQDYTAAVQYDPADPRSLSVQATIQAASVDTDVEQRDAHLRTADFFDVENNPTITFQSTGVTGVEGDHLQLAGTLTMRGQSHPVVLDVVPTGAAQDPWGHSRVGFRATGRINRSEWGVSYNQPLAAGGLMLSEEIEIVLNVSAVQQ